MPVPTARCWGELFLQLIVLLALLPVVRPQMVIDQVTGSGTTTTTETTPTTPTNFYVTTTPTSTICSDLPASSGYVAIVLNFPYFINGIAHDTLYFNTFGYFTDEPHTLGNMDSRCDEITDAGLQKPMSLIGNIIRPGSAPVNICYRISYKFDNSIQKDSDFSKASDDLFLSVDNIAFVIVATVDDRNGAGNHYQVVLVADYINFQFHFIVHFGTLSSSTPTNSFVGFCSRNMNVVYIGSIYQALSTFNPIKSFPATVLNENPIMSDRDVATNKFACRCWMIGKTPMSRYRLCPCNWAQALADSRFIPVNLEPSNPSITCAISTATTGTAYCCYDVTSSTITSEQYLSYDEGLVYVTTADVIAKDQCIKGGLSNEYSDLRPATSCPAYQPPTTTSCGGDPFFVTSDGHTYQCSPTGYFRLYISGAAIVDARLEARDAGASSIVAVAARNGTATIVFELNSQGGVDTTVSLSGITTPITDANFVDGVAFSGGVTITRQPATDTTPVGYIAKFLASNFQVLVRAWSNPTTAFLESIVLLDQVLLRTPNGGLIGPFDGSIENDLTNPDGESISLASSSRQILEEICLAWEVRSSHIFPTTITFPAHTPLVCDETTFDAAAVAACDNDPICECTATALGVEAGMLTLGALEDVNDTIRIFNNNPPFVTREDGSSDLNIIFAEVGVPLTITYIGEDPDGQTTTLAVSGEPTTAFSFIGGVLSWTPADRTPITELSIVATDELNTAGIPLDITVILCDHSGNGMCRFDTLLPTYSPTDRFQLVATLCVNGYRGDFCDMDFDGCAPDTHQCLNDTSCLDATPEEEAITNNTYTCTACVEGADLIDSQCVDIDECSSGAACEQATCVNTFGSFTCNCLAGFIAVNDTHCEDIDECLLLTDDCQHICTNTIGSFDCSCFAGFTFTNAGICDEDPSTDMLCSGSNCNTQTTVCGVNGTDNNTAVCNCLPGFEMGSDPNRCDPIDECATSQHACRGPSTCVDTDSGYNCTCPSGYTLAADVRGCEACPVGLWGDDCVGICFCLDPATCDLATGCPSCSPGLTGGSCDEDINECDMADSCPENSACMNTIGTFLCPCDTNYVFNISSQQCDPMNACLDDPCSTFGTCVQLGITYRCDCLPGYTESDCSVELDECVTDRCQNGATCVDVVNGFLCDCGTTGYMGNLCDTLIPTTTAAPPPVMVDFTGSLTTGCELPADFNIADDGGTFVSGLQDAITTAVEDQFAVDATTVISAVEPDNAVVTFVVSVPRDANLTAAEVVNAIATGLANAVGLRCPDDTPVVINPDGISVGGVPAVPEGPANTLPLILGVVLGIAFLVLLTVLIAYCSKRVFNAGHVLVGRRTFIAGGQPPTSRYWRPPGVSMRWLPHGFVNPTGLAGIRPRNRPVDNPWAVDQYEPEADETPWNAWRGADNAYYGRAVLRPTPVSNLPALEALPSTAAPTPGRGLMFRNLPNAGGLRRTGPLIPSMPAMRLPAMPRLPAMRLPSMPSLPSIPFFRRQAPVAPPGQGAIYMTPMAMARPAVPFAMGPQMLRAQPTPNYSWQATSHF